MGNSIVHRYHKRPIDVVLTGKAATALLMTGFSFMLLGLPLVQGLGWLGEYSAIFPGLDRREVPMGILLVYLGVAFSLITAVVYTVRVIEPASTPSNTRKKRKRTFSTLKSWIVTMQHESRSTKFLPAVE